ncbi:ligand-gated channel protein [Snodgrassella alvi]|uniref:ligand-gated channel protein n=1 Tax=Snodgrassella alvi TaxID=1196083 RepID=UPI000C1F895B|nr:ligand-gated channel protein [Snodgrassella alvi]PIT13643.1 ligand-gated channel protein [Snodgrassella alvi]PIT19090.1 ligand-gated channel protein [Snodgrassella alvi]
MCKPVHYSFSLVLLPTLISPLYAAEAGLEDVVVTASGFKQQAKNAAASITVINAKELETKEYHDVTDALQDVPGVVVTGGGSTKDISIRGMSGAYTMLLIDGKRVNSRAVRPNSDGPGIEQGWMPPISAIQRIEVIRGPASALYGSDAMGGVINIITKKTAADWTGSIKTDATIQQHSNSGNTLQSSVYVSGSLIEDRLGIRASGGYSHRDEDKFIGGYKEQRMRDGDFVLSWTPDDRNTVDLEVSRSLQNRNGKVGKTIDTAPRRGKKPTDDYTLYDRNQYSVTHRGYYNNIDTQSYVQREENDNPSRDMHEKNTIFNTQTQFRLNKHTLSVGGRWQREELNDSGNQLTINGRRLNHLERDSWAIFGQDEWRIVPTFALTAAARLDHDENYGSEVTPKLYGVWTPTKEWTIKGGYSRGYKAPALRAASDGWGQVTGGGYSNGIIVGNSNLKPEKSDNVEVSFNWDNNRNLSAGVTTYYTKFKNKITEVRTCQGKAGSNACSWRNEYFDFISQRENVDKAVLRGVEATFGWKITPKIDWSANYTYTHSEQKSGQFSGKPLNEMPKNMFNTTLNWNANEKFSSWARWNFRSRTSDYLSRTSMAIGKPSYGFVDTGLVFKPKKDVIISGGIYNIFDKRVDQKDYGRTLDGRRYNISAQVNF